jgi:exosortase/archaeosortase family protein
LTRGDKLGIVADRHRIAVWLRVLMLPVGVVAGFVLLQYPVRELETVTSAGILQLFGARGNVPIVSHTSILVVPTHQSAFWVLVEPSCSSLASLLALVALAFLLPRSKRGRSRLLSATVACICVFVGNLVRISSSLAVGVFIGRQSLVLFHDWVGSVFGFAYTLGGFVVMLWLMLPKRSDRVGGAAPAASKPERRGATPLTWAR